MEKNLLVLGMGGYSKVVYEIASSMSCFKEIAFLDDNNEKAIGKLEEYKSFFSEYQSAFVAIGNPDVRLTYLHKLHAAGFDIPVLVSTKAYVSPSAKLGKGSIIEPMAVVHSNAVLDEGVLVCAGSVVNHDAVVSRGCQLDCGSVVASGAVLAEKTKLMCNEVYRGK